MGGTDFLLPDLLLRLVRVECRALPASQESALAIPWCRAGLASRPTAPESFRCVLLRLTSRVDHP